MNTGTATDLDTAAFETLDQTLRSEGPGAAIERLIQTLSETRQYRPLLDAMLLKARHDLGLPLIQTGSLGELPEPTRTRYEDRYIEAIRHVGGKLLETGDIPGAWPYFRAIAEKEPVAEAIEAFQGAENDERTGQIIEVAFNQGVHPRKGFELILENYGPCSAITAYEHLPQEEAPRVHAADLLVRHLHKQLTESLRAEIERRGQPLPPEGTPIPKLIEGRDWLFADEAYHIDTSHLAAVVRMAILLQDRETIRKAVELTDYGRNLSERLRYEGEPPFERTYEDHALYLRALLGQDEDAAIAHFRAKLGPPDPDGSPMDSLPAQVLVQLLLRLGRLDEAIAVSAEHLAGLPDAALMVPSLVQLCQQAGQQDRLAQLAKERGDLVNYTAARLQAERPSTS